jgi:hypothetical protein
MHTFEKFVKGLRLRDNDSTGIGDLSAALTAADNGAIYVYQNRVKAWLSNQEYEIITNNQTQTLTNKTINANDNDIVLGIEDLTVELADANKVLRRDAAGVVVSDKVAPTGDFVGTSDAQTITNKTIDGDNNTIIDVGLASLKEELADANKVLRRNGSGTVVSDKDAPTGDFVGTSDTQTITNKTINADSNTITNIENANIKAGASIDAAKIANGQVSNTEFQYLDGVTSSIQTQIDAKVAGPASATANAITRFDGTTGKLVKNSSATLDDSGNLSANNIIADGTLSSRRHSVQPATSSISGSNQSVDFSTASHIVLTNAALVSINRLSNPENDRLVFLTNATTNTITLLHNQGSPAENRIITADGQPLELKNNKTLQFIYSSNSSTWRVVGSASDESSGQGGINYITNFNFETNAASWQAYADAAATVPVDGIGGSPNVTITRTTTSPLRGSGSGLITKDAANRQGQGASTDFTIDSADQARKLLISFDYDASHANYADGDVRIFVYDKTNAQLIRVNGEDLMAGKGTYFGQFQTNSNSVEYRLIFHVATTKATTYTVKIDNVQVGPREIARGIITSPWTTFTPTSNITVGNGTLTAKWRRSGSNLQMFYTLALGSTTVFPAGQVTVDLPPTLQMDLAQVNIQALGNGWAFDASASAHYVISPFGNSTTSLRFSTSVNGNSLRAAVPFVWAVSDVLSFEIDVPIVGWSETSQLSEDFGGRDVVATFFRNGDQSIPTASNTAVILNALVTPENPAFSLNASTGVITINESGFYAIDAAARFIVVGTATYVLGEIRLNGTVISRNDDISGITTRSLHMNVARRFYNKGDTIDFLVRQEAGGNRNISGVSANTWLSIYKIQGNQSFFETETVALVANSTSGQSFANNTTTTVIHNVINKDTHNAYNTTNGIWTCPVSGYYSIKAYVRLVGMVDSSNRWFLSIVVNADTPVQGYGRINFIQINCEAMATVFINKGDQVYIALNQNNGASRNATTDPQNHLSIIRIK